MSELNKKLQITSTSGVGSIYFSEFRKHIESRKEFRRITHFLIDTN
jgi:hypothetical protein